MLKRALYTYFREYHPRNHRKFFRSFQGWWLITYMLIVVPFGTLRDVICDSTENVFTYFGLVFLFMFSLASMTIPLALQKQMFLCPMQEKERKQYVGSLLGIKIVVPIILSVLLMSLHVLLFQNDIIRLCYVMVAIFSLIVSGILYPAAENCKKIRTGNKACCIINMCIAVITFCAGFAMLDGEPISQGMTWAAAISALVQLTLDLLIMKCNIPIVIENATDYETCLRIQEREAERRNQQWQQ